MMTSRRPPIERRHRTLTYDEYLKVCEETGNVSDPWQLLAYLHNTGTVFFREGLFQSRIILDQGWALESIYAVFHRTRCYAKIVRQSGRFTLSDLAEWIWNEEGHSPVEQKLLLSMMESCGICFQHRPASADGKIEAEYVAPDLLPEKPRIEIAKEWDKRKQVQSEAFAYAFLPTR